MDIEQARPQAIDTKIGDIILHPKQAKAASESLSNSLILRIDLDFVVTIWIELSFKVFTLWL